MGQNTHRRLSASMLQVCGAVILLLFLIKSAAADWINLTGAETSPNIAEITVFDDHVSVRLEIYVGDLELFKALIPDKMLKDGGVGRPPLEERLANFGRNTFKVLGPDGNSLSVNLVRSEPRLRVDRKSPFAGFINPQTRRPVPEPPKDKRVLYVELEYPFEGKPESLTISPPQDENGNVRVGIGFIAYHKAVPIIDFRYLGADATVELDWQDPWYTKFQNRNLKRHHKSAMMSFLYVEPRELRHEMLIRVRDLEGWIDLGLSAAEALGKEQQAQVKEKVKAFLVQRNPLTADGVRLKPSSIRAEFLRISLTGLQVIEESSSLERSTAIIGVILSYHIQRLPERVTVKWDLFNDRIRRIPASAIDPAGPFKTLIDASEPKLEWKNFLLKYEEPKVEPVTLDVKRAIGVPVFSLALVIFALAAASLAVRPVGFARTVWSFSAVICFVLAVFLWRVGIVEIPNPWPGAPNEETSGQIVVELLNNVNAAFLERDPRELKKALSVTVDEDALSDVQVELGRALAVKTAGGGTARVGEIEDLKLQNIDALEEGTGFRSLAEWTVKARAGHWGHPHRSTIKFRALMEVADVKGTWKLIGLTVVDAQQQS